MPVFTTKEYKCDICDGDTFEVKIQGIRDNSGTVGGSFDIRRCKKCGLHSLSPYPNRDEIKNLYPKKYHAHDGSTKRYKSNLKWKVKHLCYRNSKGKSNKVAESNETKCNWLGRILAEPPMVANGKLLDVGSGWGEYVHFAGKCGWDARGMEPDDNAVRVGREMGLKIVQGTAEDIPFEDSYFDVVRSWQVLEHTYSPMKAISEMGRVIKPNGHLLISVPNYGSSQRKVLGRCWQHLDVPRHLHHFTADSLKKALAKNGLEPVQRLYSGMPFFEFYWRMVVCRIQGVPISKALVMVTKSVIREVAARIKGVEAGAYITWWIRKHEN